MKKPVINDTREYHKSEIDSLGWEVTVCNMLEQSDSIVQNILKKKSTFGTLLFDHIEKNYIQHSIRRALEVGGGYGYIMRDLLMRYPSAEAVMLDISSYLIRKQKETLWDFDVDFVEKDFFETDSDFLSGFDTVILNENMGDFETVAGLSEDNAGNDVNRKTRERVINFIEKYKLKRDMEREISLNTGAIKAVEKLCSAGIELIYLGEHSCEPEVPGELEEILGITRTENPERIMLKGHDEYTIKFSDLIAVAEKFHYRIERGSFADIIQPELTDELITLLRSSIAGDKTEIIQHFIHDLYRYEYLILKA